ncbi:MAG TPA: hypothetical protein VGS23_04880 [Thermoplasmata archaeon]|nr:hypothetical protein [Thermoplasmata archaeon]
MRIRSSRPRRLAWVLILTGLLAAGWIGGSPGGLPGHPQPAAGASHALAGATFRGTDEASRVLAPSVPGEPGSPRGSAGPLATPSIGTLYSTVKVDTQPIGAVYDAQNGYVYVANYYSNSVTVINGTTALTSVVVPSEPEGGGFDPTTGFVDIASYGGNSITFLNGTIDNGSVAVGTHPYGAVYDAQDKEVYVPNFGSDNITLLRGTHTVGSVALPPGAGPVAVAYDAADSEVYVSDYALNSVSILSGSTVVKTIHVGMSPGDLAYDAANQEVYVTGSASDNVTTIQGLGIVANIPLGYPVWGATYDSANQLVYLTDNGTNNVTALRGGQVLGTLPTGGIPYGDAFDGKNGFVYVTNYATGNVVVINTALLIGDLVAFPTGDPVNTTDLGQVVGFNASVQGNQSWNYTSSVWVTPTGLGCAVDPSLSLSSGSVVDYCTPQSAGNFEVRLYVNATQGVSVSSQMAFTVYPKFTLGAPVASAGSRHGVTGTDLGLTVTWNLTATGGTQQYNSVGWTGFPTGDCVGTSSPNPSCVFHKTGTVTVFVTATDTNGATSTSPGLLFPIDTVPTATTPTSNRTTVDVGQSVQFTTRASGGSGGYTYSWYGVPASCSTTSVPVLDCAPTQVGTGVFSVSVKVTDSVSGSSPITGSVGLVIYSDPVALAPVASPARVSTGEPFTITVNISGGVPDNESVAWQGLPGGCGPSPGELIELTVDCKTDLPGTYLVFVTVTDGDHFQANSPKTAVVVTGNPITNQTNAPPPSTILGVPAIEFEGGLGVVVLLIVVAVAWGALRARSRPPSDEGPEPPPEEEPVYGEEAEAAGPPDEGEPTDEPAPEEPPSGDTDPEW